MSSIAYVADDDDTNKVYFEVDPVPTPLPIFRPVTVLKQVLPGRSSGVITPGPVHHFIGGANISGATISVSIALMTRTSYDNIISKMTGTDPVIFSPDGGTTKYKCSFSESGGTPEYIPGTDYIKWTLTLNIIEEVA